MRVDVLALLDVHPRAPDVLAITVHDASGRYGFDRDLMARRHRIHRSKCMAVDPQIRAGRDWHARNRHVIRAMEVNRRVLRRR